MSLASEVAAYVAGLTITQGARAGESFNVLPWQRRFLRGALAHRRSESALSIARGNGKTTFTSGIACAALDGPLAVPRGEVLIVASSFTQARIGFEHVREFMAERTADRGRWRLIDNSNTALLEGSEHRFPHPGHRERSTAGARARSRLGLGG